MLSPPILHVHVVGVVGVGVGDGVGIGIGVGVGYGLTISPTAVTWGSCFPLYFDVHADVGVGEG